MTYLRTCTYALVLGGAVTAAILANAANKPASLVLTSVENGLKSQSEFVCSGKIHGYIRLPRKYEGKHLLEGLWTAPTGKMIDHSRTQVDFPPPGRSTAYVWLAFPTRAALGTLNPEADKERLSYNGPWQVEVRWDEQLLVRSSFTVHCQ